MSGRPFSPVLRAIVLDTGPLSLAAKPKPTAGGLACNLWVERRIAQGVRVVAPEIADYEVRRALLQADLSRSVAALDQFLSQLDYLPVDTATMRRAAQLWAQARQSGRPTADPHALDGGVILAAQSLSLGYAPAEVAVATTNVGHLSQFVPAKRWSDI